MTRRIGTIAKAGMLLVLAGAPAWAEGATYAIGVFSDKEWRLKVEDGSIGTAEPSWLNASALLECTKDRNLIPLLAGVKGHITFSSRLSPEAYYRVVFRVLDERGKDGGQRFVAEKNHPLRCLAPRDKQLDNVYFAQTLSTIFITGDRWPEREASEEKKAAS